MEIYHVIPKLKNTGYDPDWPASTFSSLEKALAYKMKLAKSKYDPDLVNCDIFVTTLDEEPA